MRKFIIFLLLVYASFSCAAPTCTATTAAKFKKCLKDVDIGGTVYVKSGVYTSKEFIIDKDVTIEGLGSSLSDVKFVNDKALLPKNRAAFFIEANNVAFKNVSINSKIYPIKIQAPAGGTYSFLKTDIKKQASIYTHDAIYAKNKANSIIVENSTIEGHGGISVKTNSLQINSTTIAPRGTSTAVWLREKAAKANIDNLQIVNTRRGAVLNGIGLDLKSDNITIKNSKIEAYVDGIGIRESKSVTIEDSTIIVKYGGSGISSIYTAPINIQKASSISIKGCVIDGTKHLALGARAIILDKDVLGSVSISHSCITGGYIGIGIDKDKRKKINITNSTIGSYRKSGLWYKQNATVTMSQSCISGNAPLSSENQYNGGSVYGNYWDSIPRQDKTPLALCPPQNICGLVYNFRFDECDLNNGDITKNEILGFSSGMMSSKPNNPNRATQGEVCGAANLQQYTDYIKVNDVSDTLNKTASLMFWINTTQVGTNKVYAGPLIFGRDNRRGSDIFWGWIDAQGHIGISVNDDKKSKSDKSINDGAWHHVVLTRDATNNDYMIFIDGILDKYGRTGGSVPNFDGWYYDEMGTGNYNNHFYGKLDELKIYSRLLTSENVRTIYNNEKNGKNYDGTARVCMCRKVQFDAWDIFRDINDRNISTKIVNKDFKLTIASLDDNKTKYQDFNGSVCVQIVDDANISISPWKKWQAKDKNITTLDFTVPKANKNARASIVWKKDVDETCPLSNETNRSKSTDNFAIRPDDFNITVSNKIKAGEDFNITFRGLDFVDKNSTDYNESVGSSFEVHYKEMNEANCTTGTFDTNLSKDWSFADGFKRLQNSYDEVGSVDINISDTNLSCSALFAAVDCKDKNVSNARGSWKSDDAENGITIGEYNKTISFTPHHFDINSTVKNAYNDFTYLSRDLNMSAVIDINISAKNADGTTTTNYSPQCYAKNIDLNLSYEHTAIGPNSLNSFLYKLDEDALKNGNKTIDNVVDINDINKSVFGNGIASLHVRFNFDRNNTQPINPFDINISDINISDENGVRETNETNDGNATFFYGRIVPQDIITTKEKSKTIAEIEVYNDTATNGRTSDMIQNSLNWYRNKKHDNNTSIGHLYNGKDSEYGSNLPSASNGMTINTSQSPSNGTQQIDFSHTIANNFKRTIHFETNPWLWYNDSSTPHDYNSSGLCLEHPCLVYEYIGVKRQTFINSGDFNSSDFNITGFDANETENRGVKVFR